MEWQPEFCMEWKPLKDLSSEAKFGEIKPCGLENAV